MPASPAQIEANRRNAIASSGPKSEIGEARSRANSLKHGMTGAGVVLPEADAAEVDRLAGAFRDELQAEGEVGAALARRMAVMSVRMDRAVVQEAAALSDRVRRAKEDFQLPEYAHDEESEKFRAEACNAALFDASKEAVLARKYEAAAERSFFRALKELRQLRRDRAAEKPAAEGSAPTGRLASFFPAPAVHPTTPAPVPPRPLPAALAKPAALESAGTAFFDVPIAIGRAR